MVHKTELLSFWLVFVAYPIPNWGFQEKKEKKTDKSYKISKLLPFKWADHSCVYCVISLVFSEYFNVSQLSPITLHRGLIRDVKLRSLYNTFNSNTHSLRVSNAFDYMLIATKLLNKIEWRPCVCLSHRVDRPLFLYSTLIHLVLHIEKLSVKTICWHIVDYYIIFGW